jgi:hypothetical protein
MTALTIHGTSDAMPASIHLTLPRPFRGHLQGVVIHRAPLPDQEREARDDVPVTTLERTLRDVASMSDPALVGQAIEQAIRRGVLSRRQLRTLVRDAPAIAPLVVDVLGATEGDAYAALRQFWEPVLSGVAPEADAAWDRVGWRWSTPDPAGRRSSAS